MTDNVLKPEVVRIILSSLVSTVAEDGLDLVFLLELGDGVCGVDGVGDVLVLVKFVKVLYIVDIVWNFATTAGDSDFLCGLTVLFFALVGRGTIIRIRVGR